jgi:hypothetical protein
MKDYSYIEICLKFNKKGYYLIYIFGGDIEEKKLFQFMVKIKKDNEEKCVFNLFKKLNNREKEIIELLRRRIIIFVEKLVDCEENKIFVPEDITMNKSIVNHFVITPLFDFGTYEFEMDEEGNIREKMFIEADNIIVHFNDIPKFKKLEIN